MTASTALQILIGGPLATLLLSVWFSDWLRRRFAVMSAAACFVTVAILWASSQEATVIPTAELQTAWLPGIPVDFALGISGLGLPFLLVSHFSLFLCAWQNLKREAMGAYFLLALQLSITLMFTALDLVLFCAAVESFFLLLFLLGKLESVNAESLARSSAIHLVSGALWIGGALTLGLLNEEQFHVFSTRVGSLRDLQIHSAPGGPGFADALFWILALGTFLRTPLVPLHYWMTPLSTERGTSRTLSVALSMPIAVFSFSFWILPVLGDAFSRASSTLSVWAAASWVYAAAACWATRDLGRWTGMFAVAIASLAILGITLLKPDSFSGSLYLAVSWPAIVCAWSLILNWIEDSLGSRNREDIGALFPVAPRAAILTAVLLLFAAGLPGTGMFSGLLLIGVSVWQNSVWVGILFFVGLAVLGLSLVDVMQDLLVGRSSLSGTKRHRDISWMKVALISLCVVLSLWIGLKPQVWRARWEPALRRLWKTRLEAKHLPSKSIGGFLS